VRPGKLHRFAVLTPEGKRVKRCQVDFCVVFRVHPRDRGVDANPTRAVMRCRHRRASRYGVPISPHVKVHDRSNGKIIGTKWPPERLMLHDDDAHGHFPTEPASSPDLGGDAFRVFRIRPGFPQQFADC
jgi:hypothetical protein